jgi:hypothetical protein
MNNNEKYFNFLDNLRESGAVNMFGATPYLRKTFKKLSEDEAREILKEWMHTYSERHTTTKVSINEILNR